MNKHPDHVAVPLQMAEATGASGTTNAIWNIQLPREWVYYVYHKKCVPAGIKTQSLTESGRFSCHGCGRTIARRQR